MSIDCQSNFPDAEPFFSTSTLSTVHDSQNRLETDSERLETDSEPTRKDSKPTRNRLGKTRNRLGKTRNRLGKTRNQLGKTLGTEQQTVTGGKIDDSHLGPRFFRWHSRRSNSYGELADGWCTFLSLYSLAWAIPDGLNITTLISRRSGWPNVSHVTWMNTRSFYRQAPITYTNIQVFMPG